MLSRFTTLILGEFARTTLFEREKWEFMLIRVSDLFSTWA